MRINVRKAGKVLLSFLAAGILSSLLLCAFAVFAADEQITVTASVQADGSGAKNGNVILLDVQGNEIAKGTEITEELIWEKGVTLKAEPAKYYRFVRWQVGAGGVIENNPLQLSKQSNTFTAVFEKISYNVIYESSLDTTSYTLQYSADKPTRYEENENLSFPSVTVTGYSLSKWSVSVVMQEGETSPITKEYSYSGNPLSFSLSLVDQNKNWTKVDHIVLKSFFEPKQYEVTRYDVLEDETSLGTGTFQADFESEATSQSGDGGVYRGYYDVTDYATDPKAKIPSVDTENNAVYRTYAPKNYPISYQDADTDSSFPTEHIFGTGTVIPNPVKTGFTFEGWELVSDSGTDWTGSASLGKDLTVGGTDYDNSAWTPQNHTVLTLKATWTPNQYEVSYTGLTPEQIGTMPAERTYGVVFDLSGYAPTKTGYVFSGWRIAGTQDAFSKTFSFNSETVDEVGFEAGWEKAKYTITLKDDATDEGTPFEVTYDESFSLTTVPQKIGHSFEGYYQSETCYIGADGSGIGLWSIALNEGESFVLIAKWETRSYLVAPKAGLTEHCTVEIGAEKAESLSVPYGTDTPVKVTVNPGYKLVSWFGTAVSHTQTYEATVTVQEGGTELDFLILQIVELNAPGVDYEKEIFTGFKVGNYRMTCGTESNAFSVNENGEVFGWKGIERITCFPAQEYFGKTVSFVLLGDSINTADSDAVTVTPGARPLTLRENLKEKVNVTENGIVLEPQEGMHCALEYSCVLKSVLSVQQEFQWQTSPVFSELQAGTPYVVLVRIRASQTNQNPHGEPLQIEVCTEKTDYESRQIARLNLLAEGSGTNVRTLVEKSILLIRNQTPSEEYCNRVENIVAETVREMEFAKVQDKAYADLADHADRLIASGAYDEKTGVVAIRNCLSASGEEISKALTESEVTEIYQSRLKAMRQIGVTNLSGGDGVTVMSYAGIHPNYRLSSFGNVNDLDEVSKQIGKWVSDGKVIGRPLSMSNAEATKMLEEMDVKAYYQVRLLHTEASNLPSPQGRFRFSVKLPEGVAGEHTVVGVLNTVSGTVETVPCNVSGGFLTFESETVSDFVVLCDHATDFSGVVLLLMILLAVQLFVIVFLFVSRRKNRIGLLRHQKTYGFVPSVLFAGIQALNSLSLVWILILLIAASQLVILWLLFSSGVRYKDRSAKAKQEEELRRIMRK